MIFKNYAGYMEGLDLSETPMSYLSYPSSNVLTHKGTAYTRPGIKNDGNAPVLNTPIIGEFVWKDSLSGELALRATGTQLQLRRYGKWVTIFTGFSATALRVRFATWTDSNGAIIKRRLFMVDGTDKIYEWNGAVGTIASTASNHVTLSGTLTLQQLGFDPGNATAQNVQIVRFSGGAVTDISPFTASDDATTTTMTLSGTPTNVPAAGDLVIGSVITNSSVLARILKDDLYDYQNHLVLASLTSIRVYFSDVVAKLSYTVPVPASRTATSPFFVNLPGNYTAMIQRFNQSTQTGVLWISTVNIWTKVTALLNQDNFGNWVNIQTFAQSENLGAYPFAIADYKGDAVYLAQDNTIHRIQTIDVLSKDSLVLISNEIEDLLKRLNPKEVRIYYYSRYIFICYPAVSTTIMLDMVEGRFQPPQTLPMGLMSVIGGKQYGHSNVRDETFQLFVGRNDLGSPIQSVFAFPYYQGFQFHRGKVIPQDMMLKSHGKMGVSCRMTKATVASVVQYMENGGTKAKVPFEINGKSVVMYNAPDEETWASHLWGETSIGAGDPPSSDLVINPTYDPNSELGRVYAFTTNDTTAWFEYRAIITVNPIKGSTDQEFHLLAWFINDAVSEYLIPSELFVPTAD